MDKSSWQLAISNIQQHSDAESQRDGKKKHFYTHKGRHKVKVVEKKSAMTDQNKG